MLGDPGLVWLAATVAVEVAMALPLLGRCDSLPRRLLAIVGVNLVSFPLALTFLGFGAVWIVVEGAVVALEALGYAVALGVPLPRAAGAALVANVVTASLTTLL
ncbi:MAG: hypothetical protein AAGB93_23910 [Planctomycetota bacterium]